MPVTVEQFESVLTTNYHVPAAMARQYAQIAHFLYDKTGVVNALRHFDNFLTHPRFEAGPEDRLRTRVLVPEKVEATKTALSAPPRNLPAPADSAKYVRRFHFRKALASLENLMGLTDQGHVISGNFGQAVRSLVQSGRVWKDVLGVDHGDYTHRLQWVAIFFGVLNCSRTDLQSLYTSSMNFSAQLPEDASIMYVWDFCVDCFDRDPENIDDARYNQAVVSGRFRSPAVLTRYLLRCDELPNIQSYLLHNRYKLNYSMKPTDTKALRPNVYAARVKDSRGGRFVDENVGGDPIYKIDNFATRLVTGLQVGPNNAIQIVD